LSHERTVHGHILTTPLLPLRVLAEPCRTQAVDPPQVHSVSYGGNEAGLNASYARRFNIEMQKAGSRGLSILVAAGDDGVGCSLENGGSGKNANVNRSGGLPITSVVLLV